MCTHSVFIYIHACDERSYACMPVNLCASLYICIQKYRLALNRYTGMHKYLHTYICMLSIHTYTHARGHALHITIQIHTHHHSLTHSSAPKFIHTQTIYLQEPQQTFATNTCSQSLTDMQHAEIIRCAYIIG